MQSVLSLLIAIVLGVSALAFVLYPFYRRAPAESEKEQAMALFPLMGAAELAQRPADRSQRSPACLRLCLPANRWRQPKWPQSSGQ